MTMPMMTCPDGCKCEACTHERMELAAPDLLKALQAVLLAHDMPADLRDHSATRAWSTAYDHSIELARAAVSKATS